MKQVWIVNHYAQEPGHPGGTRHYSLARHLAEYGWSATLLAASTELNTGRQRLARGQLWREESYGGIPFCWFRAPGYVGNGIGRLVNMLAFAAHVVASRSLRWRTPPDAVIGSSVHPFAAWAGLRLARRHGVPFIFEVRDLWPQTLVDLGAAREGSLAVRLLRRLEVHLYRAAARIVVLMPKADEYICRLGIPRERIVWIPNGVELTDTEPDPPRERAFFTLMYFGAHGQANGLDNLLAAMARLRGRTLARPLRLRLIGDGPLKPTLITQAKRLGLDNVSFEPPVAKTAIPSLATEADAFVLNLVDRPIFRYGISPNKLFDYLAAGRPILFSCAAVNDPVADAGAGLSVKPGDPDALAETITKLVTLPDAVRAEMGRKAVAYVHANHDFRLLAQRLANCLDAAVQETIHIGRT